LILSLGVLFDRKMTFKAHVKEACCRASKVINGVDVRSFQPLENTPFSSVAYNWFHAFDKQPASFSKPAASLMAQAVLLGEAEQLVEEFGRLKEIFPGS
jgi:hypothetical protein